MYSLDCERFRYSIDEKGRCTGFLNKITGYETVLEPDFTWRLIYSEGERTEIPVYCDQQPARITAAEDRLIFSYDTLQGDGRILKVALDVRYRVENGGLVMDMQLKNSDPDACVQEIYLCPLAGIRSLSGKPAEDSIAWPKSTGIRVPNPAFSDLSVHSGFRKYERHDQYHTDLVNTYPARLSMQWFDLYNSEEGIYVGSHDTTRHTVAMACERDVRTNTLRMGAIRYPMLKCGESEPVQPVVIIPHQGDWHEGAKIYRAFMTDSGLWQPPRQADWAKDFQGWLRLIFKQHHMECNWTFADIPALYDETEAAGMNTIFLLGWEKGGFARMWPDYVVDEGPLGGTALLKKGIDYVHAKGGKVIMFLSYSLLDHQSDYYLHENGEACTIKTIWNTEVPFSETYCGEGTYRKLGNPPMPMYLSCPGCDQWQEKMKKSARDCLDLGVDGVLYDLGGLPPYFCYDPRHNHKKPSHAFEQKADRFRELRETVRSYGDDRIILMEHNVDVFNQHMDIVQPSGMYVKNTMPEMYRYTFPELILTNREMGQDEVDYRWRINFTAAYGLRYDMTIWRCCGSLKDIPNYAAYLTEVNALRAKYGKYLLRGMFRDRDGISCDNASVRPFVYEAEDGSRAALCWNDTDTAQTFTLAFDGGERKQAVLEPSCICVIEA